MREIIVENLHKDTYLLKYIQEKFPSLSYAYLNKALRNKDIHLNNKRINKDMQIKENDRLELYISDNILFNIPNNIEYVYEDNNIIVAYKPCGILSNDETDNISEEPTFLNLIKNDRKTENIQICHRLDRNTAGLIIFSKNNNAYKEITEGLKNKNIQKEYIAYVINTNFKKDSAILQGYILKDPKNTGFSKIVNKEIKDSKEVITEYEVISKDKITNIAILSIKLHTGRTHQIRVHLKSIGHPILGDNKYGNNEINRKFKIYKQMLFSYKYSFNFNKNSILYYLNNIVVSKLPNDKRIDKLGDHNGKNGKIQKK